MRPCAAALVLGIVVSTFQTASAAGPPYDFRGARLGMGLQAFRHLKLGPADAKVLCSGDAHALPIIAAAGRKAGWIYCAYYTYFKPGKIWELAPLRVGPTRGTVSFYFFREGGRGEAHLFLIKTTIPAQAAPALVEGLSKRFGPPKAKEITKVQNAFGATFNNLNAAWKNETSSIYLRQRDKRIDEGGLAYWDERLKAAAIKALNAAQKPKSGGL